MQPSIEQDRKVAAKKEELGKLSSYDELKTWLSTFGTNAQEIAGFISDNRALVSLGFTQETATLFATELKKRGLTVNEAAEELAASLQEHKTLGAAITDRDKTKRGLDGEIVRLGEEREALVLRIKAGTTQVIALEGTVASLNLTVTNLNEAITKAGDNAKGSMDTMVTEAKTAIDEVSGEAEAKVRGAGNELNAAIVESTAKFKGAAESVKKQADAVENEIGDAMNRAIDVGKQIQGLEPIARIYRFISERKGKPEEVYPIALDFIEGLGEWQRTLHGYGYINTYELDELVKEMKKNWGKSVTG
jgi:chromosome segregation ATPase